MAARRAKSAEPLNSRLSASSEKWPTLLRSPTIRPRSFGISFAAAARRASAGMGGTIWPPKAGVPAKRAFR